MAEPESLNKAAELALLHYRTLLEFFRSDPWEVKVDENISTDIVVADYLPASAAKNITDKAKEVCEAYKARIDQQLCHISTGRREARIWREWPTGTMKASMESLIRQFKEYLPSERSSWFSALTNGPTEFLLGEVSYGTCTLEVRLFPMSFPAFSESRR